MVRCLVNGAVTDDARPQSDLSGCDVGVSGRGRYHLCSSRRADRSVRVSIVDDAIAYDNEPSPRLIGVVDHEEVSHLDLPRRIVGIGHGPLR